MTKSLKKRILSLLVAAALLATTFVSTALIANGAEEKIKFANKISDLFTDEEIKNNFLPHTATVTKPDGTETESTRGFWVTTNTKTLDVEDSYKFGQSDDKWLGISWDLGTDYKLDRLLLGQCLNANFRTYNYEVYVSSDKATLYEGTPVATVTNTDNLVYHSVSLENKTAQFVGVKVLKPYSPKVNPTGGEQNLRLICAGIFGEESVEAPSVTFSNKIDDLLTAEQKANNILPKTCKTVYSDGTKGDFSRGIYDYASQKTIDVDDSYKFGATAGKWLGLYWDFEGEAILDAFVLGNCINASYRTYSYEIYASNKEDEIFSGSPLASVKNDQNLVYQKIALNGKKARYIGVKVLMPYSPTVNPSGGDQNLRLISVGAAGTEPTDRPEPLLKKILVTTRDNKGNDLNRYSNIERLNDGKYDSGADFEGLLFLKDGNYVDGAYLDITVDSLAKVAEFHDITIYHSHVAGFRTREFEVYISKNQSDLFTENSKIGKYDNATNTASTKIKLDAPVEGRYIGIRVLKACDKDKFKETGYDDSYSYVRLNEVEANGRVIEKLFDENVRNAKYKPQYKLITSPITEDWWLALGDSIIPKDTTPKIYCNGKNAKLNEAIAPKILDGKATVHNDFEKAPTLETNDGSESFVIYIKLGKEAMEVDRFAFQGINKTVTSCYLGAYEIYVGEEMDTVLDKENLVYEYDYTIDGMGMGNVVDFTAEEKPQGMWLAMKITNGCLGRTDQLYPRISEIKVCGKKANVVYYDTNLAVNMPLDVYLKSGNKLSKLSDDKLTYENVASLTDAKDDTGYTLKTDGKSSELLLNLCNDALVKSVGLTPLAGKSLGAFKVYMAQNLTDLYKESAVVFESKSAAAKKVSKAFSKEVSARYVRFVFTDGADLNLAELEVIGSSKYFNKTRNLTSMLNGSDTVTYTENMTTGTKTNTVVKSELMNLLFDTDYRQSAGFVNADYKNDSYNFLFYLGDLRTVHSISVNYLVQELQNRYVPETTKIYVGETLESVYTDGDISAALVAEHKNTKGEVKSEITFKPRLARYILISLSGNRDDSGYFDTATYAVSEISVRGTAVKGLQPDEENPTLITFKDKASGITLSINKLDNNDIIENVAGIRVEKSKPNLKQIESLYHVPVMKITNNAIYKVSLVDVSGNEVTELDGREVALSFDLPKNLVGTNAQIGDITDKTTIYTVNTEEQEGVLSATVDLKKSNLFGVLEYTTSTDSYFDVLKNRPKLNDVTDDNPSTDPDDPNAPTNDLPSDPGTSPETGENLPTAALWILLVSMISLALVASAKLRRDQR